MIAPPGSLTGEEGWRRLVEEHWPRVTAQAYRACGERSLAEDIAQEVFLKVFRNLSRHRTDIPIAHWIARITTTTTIDALRARRHSVSLDGEESFPLPSAEDDPAAVVDREETRRLVRAAILRLPGELRDVLWLTTYAELSHSDVSSTLGIPIRTVVSRVIAARQRLRHALTQQQAEVA